MQEDFELETILSVVTGINFTSNFGRIYDLFSFMFEDENIDIQKVNEYIPIARMHILTIHPELLNMTFNTNGNISEWLNDQKRIFGDFLKVSINGEKLIDLKKQLLTRR